jgi:hypothetical protein
MERQDDYKSEASQGYIVRPCSKNGCQGIRRNSKTNKNSKNMLPLALFRKNTTTTNEDMPQIIFQGKMKGHDYNFKV